MITPSFSPIIRTPLTPRRMPMLRYRFTFAIGLFAACAFATPIHAGNCTETTTLLKVSTHPVSYQQSVALAGLLSAYVETPREQRGQFLPMIGMGHLQSPQRTMNEQPYDVTINGAQGNWVLCEAFRDTILDGSRNPSDSLAAKIKILWRENETAEGQLRVEFLDTQVVSLFVPIVPTRNEPVAPPPASASAPPAAQPALPPPQAMTDDAFKDGRQSEPANKVAAPKQRPPDKIPLWLNCSIDEPNLPTSHMTIGLRVWQEDGQRKTDLSSVGVGFPFLQMCSYDAKARRTVCNRMVDVRPTGPDSKPGIGDGGELAGLAWEDSHSTRVLSHGTVRFVDAGSKGFVAIASEPRSVLVVINTRFYRKNGEVLDLERHGVCRG